MLRDRSGKGEKIVSYRVFQPASGLKNTTFFLFSAVREAVRNWEREKG